MQLIVLGSSGGYPEPGRPCSGYLVHSQTTRIWVDAGTGTLNALLKILKLEDLDCILISHLHPDHWTDLPIALHQLAVNECRVSRPLPVYGPPGWPQATGIESQWFSSQSPPQRELTFGAGKTLTIGDLEIIPVEVQHGVQTFAFRFTQGEDTLVYSGDSSPCEALVEIARGADLFLCEATLPPGEETPISMNPAQAGKVAKEAGVSRLVLTHLLPGQDPDAACAVAAEIYSGPVTYARPGGVFTVGGSAQSGGLSLFGD